MHTSSLQCAFTYSTTLSSVIIHTTVERCIIIFSLLCFLCVIAQVSLIAALGSATLIAAVLVKLVLF